MEKPPILSDSVWRRIVQVLCDDAIAGFRASSLELAGQIRNEVEAYYEPLIQQAKDLATLAEYHRLTIKHSEMMAEQVQGWRKRVEEAKGEVAREMIEDAEDLSSGGTLHDEEGYIVLSPKAIQSLKSKLEEK